jgi:valyl-tRNA synthetase
VLLQEQCQNVQKGTKYGTIKDKVVSILFRNQNLQRYIEWYEQVATNLLEIEDNFEKYRISEALMGTYKLVWDDFCSWF